MIDHTEAVEIEAKWREFFGRDPVRPKTIVGIVAEHLRWVSYPVDITERGKGKYLINQLRRHTDVLTIEQTEEQSYNTRLVRLGVYIDRFKVKL